FAPKSRLGRKKCALAGICREDNRAVEKDDRRIDIWRRGSRCTQSTTRIAPACRLVLEPYVEHLQGVSTHMQSSRSNMPGSAAPTGSKGQAMYPERITGQVVCVVFPIPVFRKRRGEQPRCPWEERQRPTPCGASIPSVADPNTRFQSTPTPRRGARLFGFCLRSKQAG